MQATQLSRPPVSLPSLPLGPDAPWLAPLAGFSDLPFRLLCREQGAAAACTEMISAKGLVYGLRRKEQGGATEDLLITQAEDAPLVVQLFGEDPDFLARAADILQERGYQYFDLNMGCSVPKVCKSGAGAALLREPQNALAAAKALLKTVGPGRAGCKIRLGWDASAPVYLDLAKALEDQGAAWICLHPRYARQGFSGMADVGALEKLVKRVGIPVIASGDLLRAEDGVQRLETGVQGVMFARGALSNPAIFRRYLALRQGRFLPEALPAKELHALILRHAELARQCTPVPSPEKRRARKKEGAAHPQGLLKMRTLVPRYVRHLSGARQLRLGLTRCEGWEDFFMLLCDFFSRQNAEEAQGPGDV